MTGRVFLYFSLLFILVSFVSGCAPNVTIDEEPEVTYTKRTLQPFTLENCNQGGEKQYTKTVDMIVNFDVGGEASFGYEDIVKASLSSKYQSTVKEGNTYFTSIPVGYREVIALEVNYSVRKGRFTVKRLLSTVYGDYFVEIPESISEKNIEMIICPGELPQAPPTEPPPSEFFASWGACNWVGVENAGINSHQPNNWCAEGSFLVGLDLDRCNCSSSDSPVAGQAQCCALNGDQYNTWRSCSWVGVERSGVNSHQPTAWCSEGTYLTSLDLDASSGDPMDSPVIGQAQCCSLPAPLVAWSSCQWVGVHNAGANSHQPETWCPDGSFLVGFDLDREGSYDAMDSPVIGQAYCCTPGK